MAQFLLEPAVDLRVYAAQALGDQADTRAVPFLIGALSDIDANVRYHAIEALGKLRAPGALDELMTILESGEFFLAFPALDDRRR